MRCRHDRFPFLLVTILVYAAPPALARGTLNPTSYTSPRGEYELFVDPTQPNGAGPAFYRMTKSGEALWQGNRRLTLRNALVSDEGFVAGYAYAGGVSSGGHHGPRYMGLTILLFAPDGSALMEDMAQEHETGSVEFDWSDSDSPPVLKLLMASERDWFAVCVPGKDPAPAVWWTYDFRAGRRAGDVTPAYPVPVNGWTHELDAQVIDEHPLVVALWRRYEADETGQLSSASASLTLLDLTGSELWRRDFPGEYDELPVGVEAWDLQQLGAEQGGFSFRSCSESARLFLHVNRDETDPERWRVEEVRREHVPAPVDPQAPEQPKHEAITLEQLGTIVLETGEAPDVPFRDGWPLAIGMDDSIGVLDFSDGDLQLVRVTMDGALLTRTVLERPDETGPHDLVQTSDGRWLALMTQDLAGDPVCTGWWIDPASGEVDSTGPICTDLLESAVATGDGGFLLHTNSDEVARYDRDAKLLWSSRQPGYGQGSDFHSVQWLDDGTFVGLTVSETIEHFDGSGVHLRSVAVSELIGVRPNYPSEIVADIDGGLILHDFHGTPPIYRISADGTVTAKFQPRHADGRTFRLYDFAVDRLGWLWVSDDRSIMRLDADGIVDRILGARPDDPHLELPTAMTIDHAGLLYAVDVTTAAVHVFNPDGTLARRCAPLPTDFADGSHASITVDGRRHIYYYGDRHLDARAYLHVTDDCTRVGFESLELDTIREEWLFQPGSSRRWVLGYEQIFLVSEDGTAPIDRRPDRTWLEVVEAGAVAPDGSLAVLVCDGLFAASDQPSAICIYGADGEPLATIPFDGNCMSAQLAFNGTTVAVAKNDALLLCDVASAQWRRHALPEYSIWFPHVTPDRRELLLRSLEATELIRYRLPG